MVSFSGNEFGEPVRQGRESTTTFVGLVGRPADKPAAPASTASSAVTRSRPTTFLSSSAAKPAHATKTGDIGVFSDFRETEADERKPSGEEEEAAEAAARRAYRTCVEQARTMDLSKLSAANYIYSAGKDKQGRNVIVLIGSRLPKFSYDKVFYHLCAFLDDQMSTDEPFIIVYGSFSPFVCSTCSVWLINFRLDFQCTQTLSLTINPISNG
jgi:hypothetical protein